MNKHWLKKGPSLIFLGLLGGCITSARQQENIANKGCKHKVDKCANLSVQASCLSACQETSKGMIGTTACSWAPKCEIDGKLVPGGCCAPTDP